jgi:hypothetical protein
MTGILSRYALTACLFVNLALLHPEGALLSSFQAGDGGWQMGSPVAGNLDADAQLELVVPYRSDLTGLWSLDAFKWNGQRLHGFPYLALGDPINVSPTLADVDGDGRAEIIFTAGANVVALRANGSVLWKTPVNSLNYVPDAGFQAVTNGFNMTPLGLFQPRLPLTAQFFSEVSSPLVADVDGDGSLDVVTAWKIDPDSLGAAQDYNPVVNDYFGAGEWGATGEVWSGGVIFHQASTGNKNFVYHFHQLVEAGLALGQAKPGASKNVYVLNDSDSVVSFDKTLPPGFLGSGMLHKKFGKNLRFLSGTYQRGVDLTSCDLDGDGLSEILVASSQIAPNWQPSEAILDDDGSILWRDWKEPFQTANQHGWFENAILIPVNPDHDNRIDVLGFTTSNEITFRSWDGVKLANRAGWPKNFGAFLPTPPVVGDLDGGGDEEIVIATHNPSQNPSSGVINIYSLSGVLKLSIPVPGGVKHVPVIADMDGDGRNDLVYRALDGKVYVQNFGPGSPALVSWSAHLGNARHDGNYQSNLFPSGTPAIINKKSDGSELSFGWVAPPGNTASGVIIQRAESPEGPWNTVATLPPAAASYADSVAGLKPGSLYLYQVAAQYTSGPVASAPFALSTGPDSNLIVNGGFEADDDRAWDKWFTGDIPWQNMATSAAQPHSGKASMQIRLQNHGSQSSITQYSHYGIQDDYLPVIPGTLYSFGGWIRVEGMSQPAEHWFEWDSSRTALHPEARPPLPWPSYFTPHLASGNASPWTYLNRVFEMPAGFPNAELRHRFSAAQPVSGSVFLDDIFFRPLPAWNQGVWQEIFPFGSRWRLLSSTAPAGWFQPGFNDSGWTEAPAKFGSGTGPHNIVTQVPAKRPVYYFRRSFILNNSPAGAKELLLAATCTDDSGGQTYPFDLYLNGNLLPTPGVEAVSGEGNVVKYFDLLPFASLLNPGANSIAVALHNTWQPDWDNIAFDMSLRWIPKLAAQSDDVAIVSTRWIGPTIEIRFTASPGTHWDLQSSDLSPRGPWLVVAAAAPDASGSGVVIDSGQNGRPQPRLIGARFYRLIKR